MACHHHHRRRRRPRRRQQRFTTFIGSVTIVYLAAACHQYPSSSTSLSLSSLFFAFAFQPRHRSQRQAHLHDDVLISACSEASSVNKQKNRQRSILLVSLPPKTDSAPSSVRRAWKWKDAALGDGRDFFVPRPRALSALNSLLVGAVWSIPACAANSTRSTGSDDGGEKENNDDCNTLKSSYRNQQSWQQRHQYVVEECGVLSNCARMDVVLVVSGPVSADNEHGDGDGSDTSSTSKNTNSHSSSSSSSMTSQAAKRVVGEALAAQLSSYGSRKQNAVLDGLASVFDLAGVINDSPTSIGVDADAFSTASELERVLVTIEGSHDVCRYLCRVASGMADRPSRPGREVPFRPFSSRDAHVMLQIKRTAEVSKGARVRALFDASLQAGKAARDPSMVPELVPLKPYGTDGRYSSDAPEYLIQAAVEAATRLGIEPAIERCLSRLQAMDSSEAVQSFRGRVERKMVSMGIDLGGDDGLVVRRVLHKPCMTLREGGAKEVDEDEVLQDICHELGMSN
eukprot:CAMPEP_0178651414 /NCGR_PEP_ID=MMETSP0698-20121128/22095_1 /TAXON_ID=265572 /ORGANISM="Extubocellulus spinifer, Strain CCMP396" /LENGTH=512 /DNA_ID=CAMNT_0020293035 /DNA_START=18 /DNA_END=1556 /DNA_ORIENTATION=+